jgi:hypothetical protein
VLVSEGVRAMRVRDPIGATFQPLYGKPCWNAKKGYSSFLTFEFGQPHVELSDKIRERPFRFSAKVSRTLRSRLAYVHGEWHLWIYCCAWSIALDGWRAAHGESRDLRIDRAVAALNGQALTRVSVNPADSSTVFEFDLGGTLRTWAYDETSEQWILFEPAGTTFTLGPRGRYRRVRSDAEPKRTRWRTLSPPAETASAREVGTQGSDG